MRVRIHLDTVADATKFSEICAKLNGKIVISDGAGLKVNGKSVLGALHALEFNELWCESENDIYASIQHYVD